MSYLKKGLKGLFALFVLGVLANIIGYFTRLVLTRTISVEQYGLFYSVLSLIMFLMMFSNLGYGNALVKYVSKFKTLNKLSLLKFTIKFTSTIRVVIVFILGLLLFVFARTLETNFFKSAGSHILIYIFALIIIFMVFNQIISRIFNAIQNNLFMGLVDFTQKVLFFVFVLLLFFLGFSRDALLPGYSYLWAVFLTFLFFVFFALKQSGFFKIKSKGTKSLAKQLTRFAMASFLIGISYMVIGYIDTLILTYFRSLTEVGIYNTVLPTVMVVSFFSLSIHHVLFPLVSELWEKDLKTQLKQGFVMVRKYSLFFVTPFVLAMLVFPKMILQVLFGSDYVPGYAAMMILAVGMVFMTLGIINQAVLSGVGKPKVVTKVLLFVVILNLILNIILIPFLGMVGAAAATTLSYFMIMLLTSIKIKSFVNVNHDILGWIKLLFCSVVFVLVTLFFKTFLNLNIYLELAVCLIAASLVYVLLAYLLKLICIKEIKFFIKTVLRK